MSLLQSSDAIAIFGARGMAGSAICRTLIAHNYQNLLTPLRSELDLLDFQSVLKWTASNKPDVVVLAAAKVGGIGANNSAPAEFLLENMKIQNNVIEASKIFGVRRLLFLGSSCIYPKYSKQPIQEEQLLTSSLEPTNEGYALAKITGVKLCEYMNIHHGFDAISLMPTNLYGLGDNYNPSTSHVMAALIKKFVDAQHHKVSEILCWGSGSPLREFLYIEDLGSAAVFALESWKPSDTSSPKSHTGQPLYHLNVGSGVEISIKELAELIASITSYDGNIVWDQAMPDGTPRKLLDSSRFRSLGWRPLMPLKVGIVKTVQMYRQNTFGSD